LSDRLALNGPNTIATASHPGWTVTELQRHSGLMRFLNNIFAMSIEKGALTTLRAAIDENAQSGDYFGPNGFQEMNGYPTKVKSNKLSQDKAIAEKLWVVSQDLTRVKYL
jgi:hypothetical protein